MSSRETHGAAPGRRESGNVWPLATRLEVTRVEASEMAPGPCQSAGARSVRSTDLPGGLGQVERSL